MTATLLTDIINRFDKNKPYGKKGDTVVVIRIHDDGIVLIRYPDKKDGFSTRIENIKINK